jgi:hypothetical protein
MRRSRFVQLRPTILATVFALLSALVVAGVALADGMGGPLPH